MAALPTNRTTSNTAAEHVADHNELHTVHNLYELYVSHGNTGATETIDRAAGNVHRIVLDANCTLTLTGFSTSFMMLTLFIVQDATGSRTITWPAALKWSGDTEPVLSTTANAVDIITLVSYDSGTTIHGTVVSFDSR